MPASITGVMSGSFTGVGPASLVLARSSVSSRFLAVHFGAAHRQLRPCDCWPGSSLSEPGHGAMPIPGAIRLAPVHGPICPPK